MRSQPQVCAVGCLYSGFGSNFLCFRLVQSGGWRCAQVLTGMDTPVGRVWRFTPADGNPHGHLMNVTTASGTAIRMRVVQGDGSIMQVKYPVSAPGRRLTPELHSFRQVDFLNATAIGSATGSTPAISTAGIWIKQPHGTPMPATWRCDVN